VVAQLRPADQFDPARQIPCTFSSNAAFATVDSSATALAAACHVNRALSGPPVAKGVRKGGLGLKKPLELDILRKLYYLRKGD